MLSRSHTSRWDRARITPLCVALALLLLAGCQSNSQHDLIAREIRVREDKIYAMEDYIAQYQQLLCQYRSENTALKRQMSGAYYDERATTSPTPRQVPATTPRNGITPQDDVPSIDVPPTPNSDETPPPLDLPDVPGLEKTKPDNANLEFRPTNLHGGAAEVDHDQGIDTASFDVSSNSIVKQAIGEAAGEEVVSPAGEAQPGDENSRPAPTAKELVLRGAVVENETGGGARILVDVMTPSRTDAAHATGKISLIVAASGGEHQWRNFGRWDFRAEDAEAVFDDTLHQPALRFHLELPPDVPNDLPVELWARMVSPDGTRLVSHVPVNLAQPSQFTSIPAEVAPLDTEPAEVAEESPVDVVYRDRVQPAAYAAAETKESGWTIARPWEPADAKADPKEQLGQWRAATQMPPEVIARASATRPDRLKSSRKVWSDEQQAPGWAPDRPYKTAGRDLDSGNSSANPLRSGRPNWSALR